ncbi:flavin-containing monooxygenase [Corynespora cassiicola Philippines]|uniref:Flavin-containing monooxygenase n=1 Tax=Corynespora cassiicola Philippines TaxID=1448308 RepID=A0A2T2P9X7_CORCC|nr:flavin-containing monooxygenase [Corynespora cassiicola Philippines]
MAQKQAYKSVAVIGAGPSGLSAVKALSEEKAFDTIRVFERRDRVGGTWLYDPVPDSFQSALTTPKSNQVPDQLPIFKAAAPEDITQRTGLYEYLDSNVGATAMEFTYASIPKINSALSVRRYGHANPTRPWRVVADYLEDIFAKHIHHVSFNTTVERLSKNERTGKWDVVLRKKEVLFKGEEKDYWWTESFDAVVVATGHYNVPFIPKIPGIEEWYKKWPERLQHSKQFRSRDTYVDKSVVVVGGSVSASDFVLDTYTSVKGPLVISQRGENANPALDNVWKLPGVVSKPTISRLTLENGGTVEFSDGTWLTGVDVVYLATGYRLAYPFLHPNPVTPQNRLGGFYQHAFSISDPSLAVVGQIRAALSLRAYEYQAVAVARVFAGRGNLPSVTEQTAWEQDRLKTRGPTHIFHTIAPDFGEYFNNLRKIAGPPAEGSEAYDLPAWRDDWAARGFRVLELKDEYVRRIEARDGVTGGDTKVLAKL